MASLYESRREQMFPKMTPAQLTRLEAYGEKLRIRASDVLTQSGEQYPNIVVLLSGTLDVVRPGLSGEASITVLSRGDFTGEMSALHGTASHVRIRVLEDGEAIAIPHESLRRLMQSDAELSELFMRAFILRRMGLLASQQGDVVLVGSRNSASTLRLQQFLGRNALPYVDLDIDRDPDVAALLDRFHVGVDDIPVVICRGEQVLKNPGNAEIAECLRMNPNVDHDRIRDLAIVGAGPAGLGAAVYAASEGLSVLVLETLGPGGQAGTSSRIENYLGFPTGISGQALAGRALVQAQKFGADVLVAGTAINLRSEKRPFEIVLSSGRTVFARTIIVATGAEYRALPLENLARFLGTGIYYAATHLEAQLCKDEEVIVVGGGNSAGQAAVYLAGQCRQVHVLVRSSGLADSMSQYLIRRITESANITLHPRTELASLDGDTHLRRVTWRSAGDEKTYDIRHVFLMTGAIPNTQWLGACIAVDTRGFLRTGPDLSREDLQVRRWPLPRPPHFLETSIPGVFAVGDVRSGSVKRVAAAVGEGSACIPFVHGALATRGEGNAAVQ